MNEAHLRRFGESIQKLIDRRDLDENETYALFEEVLTGRQPDLHQGAFLAALVAKRETASEIIGAWRAIRDFDTTMAETVLPEIRCENSGTGMDTLKTFNVSSAAALVAAACGVAMTRHGARALTSSCGTVDILESVGVDVECDVGTICRSINTAGIGLFNGMSPKIHPIGLGRILSQIRFGSTLNIAASLANPARPTHAVRGVYCREMIPSVADVMTRMGIQKGMIVHGLDQERPGGMDELSVTGPSVVLDFSARKNDGATLLHPGDFGIPLASFSDIAATGEPRRERQRFLRVIAGIGERACMDFTSLNAAAILVITGKAESWQGGLTACREALATGAVLGKLQEWVRCQAAPGHEGAQILENALADAGIHSGA